MRGLSIRQPWGWAFTIDPPELAKRPENRTWKTDYRGPLLLHTSAGFGEHFNGAFDAIAEMVGWERDRVSRAFWDSPYAVRGYVIALSDLVDIHHADDCREVVTEAPFTMGQEYLCSAWSQPDQYHWITDNVRLLETPIKARGKQGLWKPGDELVAEVREQLGRAA